MVIYLPCDVAQCLISLEGELELYLLHMQLNVMGKAFLLLNELVELLLERPYSFYGKLMLILEICLHGLECTRNLCEYMEILLFEVNSPILIIPQRLIPVLLILVDCSLHFTLEC